MAITGNPMYNDPALGAAFGSLAQAFAPPSGSDMLGYAGAAAKKAEAERLAALYAYATDPNFNQTTFDRMGIGAGVYAPTSSYYAVDQGNATTRRGQDVAASAALAASKADNERAFALGMLGPLDAGQTRAALPESIASLYGLPALPAATGAMNVGQGEKTFLPDGTVLAGTPKPLSSDELTAQIIMGMNPRMQGAFAMGSTPVETIMGATGPEFAYRTNAVGKAPAPTGTAAQPELKNYRTPDGRTGTAAFINGKWQDTQTGAPLPEGTITFGTNVQGDQTAAGVAPTTANTTEANKTEAILNAFDADIAAMRNLLVQNPGIAGTPGMVRGIAQNVATSIGEVLTAYGKDISPTAAVALEDVQAAARAAAPNRDPAIAQFNVQLANLAYRLAQMNNPSGEVSRQAFERAMETLSGGTFANNASTLEALTALSEQVQRNREAYLGTLRAPGAAPGAPAAAPSAGGRLRFDAEGNLIE